jgi:hypothetical protein
VNEQRWLRARKPQPMLAYIGKREWGTPRQDRLFAAACCRRIIHLMPSKAIRSGIEIAEEFADGKASQRRLFNAFERAGKAHAQRDKTDPTGAKAFAALAVHFSCSFEIGYDLTELLDAVYSATVCDPDNPEEEDRYQVQLIRDIYGNPFRPVAFQPDWRTSTTVGLAQSLYESRDFDRVPILADALEEAGCDSPDVLAHCRADAPHVRGCWVMDLVLGKA